MAFNTKSKIKILAILIFVNFNFACFSTQALSDLSYKLESFERLVDSQSTNDSDVNQELFNLRGAIEQAKQELGSIENMVLSKEQIIEFVTKNLASIISQNIPWGEIIGLIITGGVGTATAVNIQRNRKSKKQILPAD
mgnify:CR=1 FL=1